jgi:thiamine-phosphate diphosphorylase
MACSLSNEITMPLAAHNSVTRARARQVVRGLYGMADASVPGGDVVSLGQVLLDAGCSTIQLRAKHWPRARVERAARELLARCERVNACFILNDDVHLAREIGAHGVHIGQTDGDLAAARAAFPNGVIGRSSHSVQQALDAAEGGADYVAFGPVFATTNLSRDKPVRGLRRLRGVRQALPEDVPLVAIGGIEFTTLPSVRATGVQSWAIIRAISLAPDPLQAALQLL